MPRRKSAAPPTDGCGLPPLPIDERAFLSIAKKHRLSAKHIKIVDLMLRGLRRKQIEDHLKMPKSTLDTHMGRIFRRLKVRGHIAVVLLVTAEFSQLVTERLAGDDRPNALS